MANAPESREKSERRHDEEADVVVELAWRFCLRRCSRSRSRFGEEAASFVLVSAGGGRHSLFPLA